MLFFNYNHRFLHKFLLLAICHYTLKVKNIWLFYKIVQVRICRNMILSLKPNLVRKGNRSLLGDSFFSCKKWCLWVNCSVFEIIVNIDESATIYFEVCIRSFEFIIHKITELVSYELNPVLNSFKINREFFLAIIDF